MKSKAISIGYIAKISVGNVNASHTEGNIMTAKKVTMPDGSTLPYISGQAIRRMIRDRLNDLGEKLAESKYTLKGEQEVVPLVRPMDYIDEDLFGYLDPSGGRRRTSPVRVSAAIGMFPFRGDRDLGTRSFEKFGETMERGGNMFETEIYYNLFRGAILIELDRVGKFESIELGGKPSEISHNEKSRRLKMLFEAIKLLWGGGRTARMLTDMSPKFIAYARLKVKYPVFLENLNLEYSEGALLLDVKSIISAIERVSPYIENAIFGVEPRIFSNENDIKKVLGKYGTVTTVVEALNQAKEDVESIWKS